MVSRLDGIGSSAMDFFVLGPRISRVLSSADLLTRIVLRRKSRSDTVRARSSPARAPMRAARANIVWLTPQSRSVPPARPAGLEGQRRCRIRDDLRRRAPDPHFTQSEFPRVPRLRQSFRRVERFAPAEGRLSRLLRWCCLSFSLSCSPGFFPKVVLHSFKPLATSPVRGRHYTFSPNPAELATSRDSRHQTGNKNSVFPDDALRVRVS